MLLKVSIKFRLVLNAVFRNTDENYLTLLVYYNLL